MEGVSLVDYINGDNDTSGELQLVRTSTALTVCHRSHLSVL